uniref:Uncharacterized protein n=1 Tax=Arundo donax TaxID=35708 RepID=A0A0A9D9B3_ARUDO
MTFTGVRLRATSPTLIPNFWYSVTSHGGSISASLSSPGRAPPPNKELLRRPRRTNAAAARRRTRAESSTAVATRAARRAARSRSLASPGHRERHSAGLPSTSLVGSFAKNAISGARPAKLLKDMLSATRFWSADSGWRSPVSWLCDTSSTPRRASPANSLGITLDKSLQLRLRAISSPGILPMLAGIAPDSELPPRSRSWSREHEPISGGIWPESRFPPRTSLVSEPSLPMSAGIAPPMTLYERSRYCSESMSWNSPGGSTPVMALPWRSTNVRFRQPAISAGMAPDNLLELRSRKLRLPSLPTSEGMAPARWLPLARNRTSDVQFPISGGISPERVLSMSSSLESCGSRKRDLGMGPVSAFCDRSSDSRLAQPPISGGMLPVSWLAQR